MNRWSVPLLAALGLMSCGERDSAPTAEELVGEMRLVNVEAEYWLVEYGMESNGQWFPRLKEVSAGTTTQRISFLRGLKPGDIFFPNEPMRDRFRFLGFEDRERFNRRLNTQESVRVAKFEDLRPGKEGKPYEIERGAAMARLHEFVHADRTAVLGYPRPGGSTDEFKVEEGMGFGLPPGSEDLRFRLAAVDDEKVRIEWREGDETRSREIRIEGGN